MEIENEEIKAESKPEEGMTRREFLKVSGLFVLGTMLPESAEHFTDTRDIRFLEETPDELVPYTAILSSLEYRYNNTYAEFLPCYFHHLGINNEINKDFVKNISSSALFNSNEIWREVPPGTILYMENAKAIFMGLERNNLPTFTKLTPYGLSNVQLGVGIEELKTKKKVRNENVKLYDAVGASRKFDIEGGPVEPNLDLMKELGFDISVTININDGSLNIWDTSKNNLEKINNKEIFCVVGRKLKKNPLLSKDYFSTVRKEMPMTMYDSAKGRHIDTNGINRRALTPHIISEFQGTAVRQNFAKLGENSHTDISLLKEVLNNDGEYVLSNLYNSYTLHEVPRGTENQSVLLREPQLIEANATGHPVEELNLSGGCVNMEGETWKLLKDLMNTYIEDNKRVGVIFTTPEVDQRYLVRKGNSNSHFYTNDPFGGRGGTWEYNDSVNYNDQYRNRKYNIFPDRDN